jgi:hypothetical protein
VFVVIEHRSRRLVHYNVTAHPSAAWTLQQLREVIGYGDRYRFLIHDRDCIFASQLDESIRALGIRVLKSAPHSPKMNAVCERAIGTIRRECLDWLIPLSESHLRFILKSWIGHYNGGRPHMALGPGVPDPPAITKAIPEPSSRHRRGGTCGFVHDSKPPGKIAHDHVFFQATGQPIVNLVYPYTRWSRTLRSLKLRYRKPYAARHSSVSWELMIGKSPLWVAKQHGHNIETMLRISAAWTDGAVESDLKAIRRAMPRCRDRC